MFTINNSLKKLVAGVLLASPFTATATIHTFTGEAGGGLGSNFTLMYAGPDGSGADPAGPGGITGGATDIDGTFDDSKICTVSNCNDFAMTMTSAQLFFGEAWTAHAIRVFGPGTYTIDTDCTEEDLTAGRYDCDPTAFGRAMPWPNGDPAVTDETAPLDAQEGPNITFTVAPGQLGAHILFDWSVNKNIHVPILWDLNQTFTAATDPAFSWESQTLIYSGTTGDGSLGSNTVLCTDVGIGTFDDVSGVQPQCDTTHTAARVYKFASHDANVTAIIDRWDTALPGVPTTSGTEPDGVRGFAMVNGPFPGQNANFNLDMTPGYTPPIAVDDAPSTVVDTLLDNVDVLANDSDFEDGTPPTGATVTLLDNGSGAGFSTKGGTLVNNGDGTVDYDPTLAGLAAGETDTFDYTITDSIGVVSNTATVTVTATAAPNDKPVANAAVFSTVEDAVDRTINITATDDGGFPVATDGNSDPLTFASVVSPTSGGGSVVINGTSTAIIYNPAPDFNGADTFSFSVNDTIEDSDLATLTINVSPINDAPICTALSFDSYMNEPLEIDKAADLLALCTDVDDDTPLLDSATQPVTAGSAVVDNGTTLTYTPATDFEGGDSFTIDVTDGVGGLVTVTVNVSVSQPFGNFTMLNTAGDTFGGTNDVLFTWDTVTFNTNELDTTFDLMTIASVKPQAFFNYLWTAHHIRVYGPGSYSFDSTCTMAEYDAGTTDCGGSNPITMTVAADQIGAHIIFDWGKPTGDTTCGVENCDIDVVNVWSQNAAWDRLGAGGTKNALFLGAAGAAPDLATSWVLVSTDVNGDGVVGSPMVDGPFEGFYANFNAIAILPPGTVIGPADDVAVDAVAHSQQDTELGDSLLASMNLLGLFASLLILVRLRQVGRNK